MSYRDEQEQAHTNWVMALFQSRETAREQIIEAQALAPPNRTFYWHPEKNETANGTHAAAHAAVLNYHSDVAPYSDNIPELWNEQLTTVKRPKQNVTIDGGVANVFGEPDYENVTFEYREVPVSLSRLTNDWRSESLEVTIQFDRYDGVGETREQVFEKLYLPVRALSEVYYQLNQCLRKLNLAAEIEELASADEPPEPPEHVEMGAPGFLSEDAEVNNGR